MKNVLRVLLTGVAMLSFGSVLADDLQLVKDGQPEAVIVIADDASNYQKWAAQWLSDYVKSSSGAVLPIVAESKAPAGAMISVGHTKMANAAGISAEGLKYDGCKMAVKGRVLYLIGRDAADPEAERPRPEASGPQGTIRAVTMFLEDIVGVRWFTPGWHGTVVPPKKDIVVADNASRTFVPAVAYCDGRSPYPSPIALYANNFRSAVRYKGYGGHSWEVHVDDKVYFDKHPEYFALLPNGTRSRATYSKETGLLVRNAHLCTSNMEVRQIIVDKMRALFDQGYDMIELGQSDGWAACTCPECMKMDRHVDGQTVTRDNPCEKVWLMHKWILDELFKSHPDKLVNVLVYGPTAWPSRKFDSLPLNAVTQMAPIDEERLEAWRGKIKYLTTYMYWFEEDCQQSTFVPSLSPEWLQKTLRRYRNLGVMGIKGTPRVNWGLGGPSYYAYGRLMGDPDADIDQMLREYCAGIYQEAGPTMKRFFGLFHSRSGKTMELPYYRGGYPPEDAFTALYPPEIVHELDRLLGLATAQARTDRAKGWVKHTRDCFDGLKTVADMFAAKRSFELDPSRESLLRLKARVAAVEDWRTRILSLDKAYADEWFLDYPAMVGFLMSGGSDEQFGEYYYNRALAMKDRDAFLRGEKTVRGTGMGGNLMHHDISAPITWDFDKVMSTLGKEKQDKVITVTPARGPVAVDGRIGTEWQGVSAHPFVGFDSEVVKIHEGATTTVRVMYDDKTLYVAYECIEPSIESLKLKKVGHDGDVYSHDEVELFLNVDELSDRKVMQFAASPIEDAFYDARKGFITDPLNPNYNAWDIAAWSPEWQYAWHVDSVGKKWILEMAIPYKSLGVQPPEPGAQWTGNFGRCRRVHNSEELSSWISGTFGSEPALFGKLLFAGTEPVVKTENAASPASSAPAPTTPSVAAPATQYVANGNFEQKEGDGTATGWALFSYPPAKAAELLERCGVTAEAARSGERSMRLDFSGLSANEVKTASEVLVTQSLSGASLRPLVGKKAVFTMWVCYEGLCAPEKEGGYFPGPWFDLVADLANGKRQNLRETGPVVLNRPYFAAKGYVTDGQIIGQWLKVEAPMDIPADATSLTIRIGEQAWRPLKDTVDVNPTAVCIDDVGIEIEQ